MSPDIQSIDNGVCVSECPKDRPFSKYVDVLHLLCTEQCEHEFEYNGVVKKCVTCEAWNYVRVQSDGSRECVRECYDDELVNVSDH